MQLYMEAIVPQAHLLLFRDIKRVMEKMPNVDLGFDEDGKKIEVSCHMVARALCRIFPEVTYRDGYFARRGQRHSWLEVIKSNPLLIIDPYPIALLGGPVMVQCGFITTPWDYLYIKAKLNDLGKNRHFQKHVHMVANAMGSVL